MSDISEIRTKTGKLINGETVSYTLMASASVLFLFIIKQAFKLFFSVDASVSCLIAFVLSSIIFYLLEKRFVFHKKVNNNNLKQLLFLVLRAAVNFGFYRLSLFAFTDLLDMPSHFSWIIAMAMAFVFNYYYDRTLLFNCDYDAQSVQKSRIYKAFYNNRFTALSGIMALFGILIIYGVYSAFPFGDETVMRMDLYHQYGPLFAELYDRVILHKSFLYSWTSAGGSSFLGNYLNYLSSPLSVIIFLFDKEDISFAITTIVAVKCVLSSASFTLYLNKSGRGKNIYSSIFGVFYAFCAYFLAYYWNVMWLDAMFALPIVALGIERLINRKGNALYVISLAYVLLSNYYMGYMMCIFSVVYFIAYYFIYASSVSQVINPELTYKKKYSFKALMNNKLFNSCVNFGISSILAGAICAITLVPVFMILKGSSATSDSFPTGFSSFFPVFDFITAHFAGMEETIRSSGDDVLPNVYSGVLSIILLPLFVINRKISLKEKAGYIALLLLMLFLFNNNCTTFIMHGFHFPNDLPYRFSFMYSFILIVAGYKAIVELKSVTVKDILYVGMAWIFFVLVSQKLDNTKMTESTIYIMLAFIIMWTAYLVLVRTGKVKGTIKSGLAIIFVFLEITLSDTFRIKPSQANKDYKENYSTYTDAIDFIKNEDNGFYRTELCYLNTRMDPCYYGYDGISVFSSMAYESYSNLQKNIGMYGNTINSYTYNTQTPIYNMMFNLKYLIQTDVSLPPSDNLYSKIYETYNEKASVYENKYYLPISYCVKDDVDEWITENNNPFEIQSDFIKLATGIKEDIFTEPEFVSCSYDSATGDDITENGSYWISKNSSESTYAMCDIKLKAVQSGNFYIYVTSPSIQTIEVNSDKVASQSQSIDEPYIFDIGYHDAGDVIVVTIDAGSMNDVTESSFDFYAYSVDENVLARAYGILNESSLQIDDYSDTSVKGTIKCKENSYLYSSIPYDEGWRIYIDGEETEIFEIGETLLATTIKPGEHTVEYKYSPKGLVYGIGITAITLIGLAGYGFYDRKIAKSNRRKKQEIVE